MKLSAPIIRCVVLVSLIAGSGASASDVKKTYTFHSQRKAGQTDRVVVLLEVGGETKFLDKGKPRREKMGVVCSLDYLEKTLETPAEADGVLRGVRHYRRAAATVKVGDDRFEPALRPEHRLIGVEAAQRTALLYSPGGSLSRGELDAIDIQVNSLLLDRLLPSGPIVVGRSWPLDKNLMAAMLGLDEVAKSTVEGTLKEVTDIVARFELTGRVEGRVHGAGTDIELKGRYRFDLRTKRVDWLGMLIKEDRQAGDVADGVDVVSRLQLTVTPVKEPKELARAALDKLDLKPAAESTCLTYEFPGGGFRCRYDRRWYADNSSGVLRLMNRGILAGQCNLALLPKRDPNRLVSLEKFQEDVRKALGDNFSKFVAAGQSVNESGYRVLRVVADGAVPGKPDNVPIRWIYYHLADRQGHQSALTFTIEQEHTDRFADADEPIVESLRFVER
ncbi:MAG: hypothetical protein KKE86_02085 [Planctomycetes bacterium]|nr:hypothetical protein [Planctomycetota bacterium]MBU4398105.1 hypothetical protein [Planctomycetota bacterium]MCG2684089.1 hypothetical protein [Planctomycetales bacterium]